jgi:hypothetical protein
MRKGIEKLKKSLYNILINLCNFRKIKDFITFYATLLAVLSILVVSGIIEVKPRVNVLLLKPVIFIDVKGFRSYYERTAGKTFPSYIEKAINDYSNGRYLAIGMPAFTQENFRKVRVMNDGKRLYGGSTIGKEKEFKYELGWISEPDFWLGLTPDMGLKPLEDRRIGVSVFIQLNSLELPFAENSMSDYILKEDIFKNVIDSISDKKEKRNILISFLYNRKVYNIISLENKSDQKIYNITMKLNTSVPGGRNEIVAWTHSAELVEKDTLTAGLTILDISFLRPRTSIEYVVRSSHLYKIHDISVEWDRLKNLNIKAMKLWLIILLFITLLVQIVGHIIPKKLMGEKKVSCSQKTKEFYNNVS